MSGPRLQMIQVAARPFKSDHEQRIAMEGWLQEVVSRGTDEDFLRATERWEKVDGRKRRSIWKVAMVGVSLAALVGFWLPLGRTMTAYGENLTAVANLEMPSLPSANRTVLGDGLESNLLIGDPESSDLERAERLRESDPDNPAYFSEYSAAYQRDLSGLPSDYFEEARRLDPENAWFDLFAAGTIGKDAVERVPPPKGGGTTATWRIDNEAAFRESLALIKATRGKPRFESYFGDLLRKRIELLPQGNPEERLASIIYLGGLKSGYYSFLTVPRALSARAFETSESGDLEGFREILDDSLRVIRFMAAFDDSRLLGVIVARVGISTLIKELDAAAMKLGVDSEEPRLAVWKEGLAKLDEEKKAWRNKESEVEKIFAAKGALMPSMAGPIVGTLVREPPAVTGEQLMPGRRSEHAMFSMVSAALLGFLLVLAMALVSGYRLRGTRVSTAVAGRVEQLLRPVDWCWILGLGTFLPCALAYLMIAFTPLGGRDLSLKMSVRADGVFLPVAQFLVLWLVLMILPVLIARWRLRLVAGIVGFQGWNSVGWVSIAALVALATGYLYFPDVRVMAILGLLAPGWLLIVSIRAAFSRASRLLDRIVISRILGISYAFGVLCILVVACAFGITTQYWFDRDEFTKLTPEAPGTMPYDYLVTLQYRQETLRVLEGL